MQNYKYLNKQTLKKNGKEERVITKLMYNEYHKIPYVVIYSLLCMKPVNVRWVWVKKWQCEEWEGGAGGGAGGGGGRWMEDVW